MSLGVKLYNDELFYLCQQLHNKGTIIVAAFHNITIESRVYKEDKIF